MKKIPLVTIAVIYLIILILLFFFVVPKGGDLISPGGDFILGQVGGLSFVILLIIDFIRFKKNKIKK